MWKTVLNWGVVITFLTLPFVLMVIQLYLLSHPLIVQDPTRYQSNFKYLADFQRNLAILVFGLTGLRTFEQVRANGSPKEHQPPLKKV